MKGRKTMLWALAVLSLMAGAALLWQPVFAKSLSSYPAKVGTLELGKQGLHLSNVPLGARTVYAGLNSGPLEPRLYHEVDLRHRRPAIEMTFLNAKGEEVYPGSSLVYVYFNLSRLERKLWDEGGKDSIAIWYFNEAASRWVQCATFLTNVNYTTPFGRLACLNAGNGVYVLGDIDFRIESYNRYVKEGYTFQDWRESFGMR